MEYISHLLLVTDIKPINILFIIIHYFFQHCKLIRSICHMIYPGNKGFGPIILHKWQCSLTGQLNSKYFFFCRRFYFFNLYFLLVLKIHTNSTHCFIYLYRKITYGQIFYLANNLHVCEHIYIHIPTISIKQFHRITFLFDVNNNASIELVRWLPLL